MKGGKLFLAKKAAAKSRVMRTYTTKLRSKRYKVAIEFIAKNDDPSIVQIVDFISIILVAEIFKLDPLDVTKDVLNLRAKLNKC